ncbi:MAG: sulfotransferase family 2 domain-containing protein [Caldilineaceae bacterium]
MISHKHKFIFIHITKTAGTSIEAALHDETCQLLHGEWDTARIPHTPLNHLTLQELADYGVLTPTQLKSYFKFCIVRNPWDRLISEIFCRWMNPWFGDLSLDARIRRACEQASTPTGIANHLRLQHDFVHVNGLQMDFVGRFETLAADFGQICRILGVTAQLPHHNISAHWPYPEYYDDESKALVAATYQRDIAAFQYEFEPVGEWGGETVGQ